MRRAVLLGWLVCGGCTGTPAPQLLSVEPATVDANRRSTINVRAAELWPAMTADLDHPYESAVDSRFTVRLEGPAQVFLESPAWLSSELLQAVVPRGVDPGQYALTVVTPSGVTLRLQSALQVR